MYIEYRNVYQQSIYVVPRVHQVYKDTHLLRLNWEATVWSDLSGAEGGGVSDRPA